MWTLHFDAPAADEVEEPAELDYGPVEAQPPSLSAFTVGQLIDELRARGLNSLNFRDGS